jgi:site-specific DNA-methyltransferase (adenine-specific)
MDCLDGMKQFPDKYFELAIIDVPYGIGENGSKNHSRGKLAVSKDYKPFYGEDNEAPPLNILMNFLGCLAIRLYGVLTIL